MLAVLSAAVRHSVQVAEKEQRGVNRVLLSDAEMADSEDEVLGKRQLALPH